MKMNEIKALYSSLSNRVILDEQYEIFLSTSDVSIKEKTDIMSIAKDTNMFPVEKLIGKNQYAIEKIELENTYYIGKISRFPVSQYNDPFLSRVHFIYDTMHEGIIIFKNKHLIYRNPSLANTLNLTEDQKDVIGFDVLDVGPSNKVLEDYFMANDSGEMVLPFKFPNSDNYWFKISFQGYDVQTDKYQVMMINDISTVKEREQQYKEEQEYLNRTLESVNEAVILADSLFEITLINPVATTMLQIEKNTAKGKNIKNVIRLVNENQQQFVLKKETEVKNKELIMHTNDGLMRHVRATISTIYKPDKTIEGYVVVLIDISTIKQREREILYLSYHDVLTGLYNRTYLEEQMKRLDTSRQLPFTIMMADVNGLKLTNDVFGHDVGDQLLIKIAEIIKRSCREEDLVGRYGGDEFVVLLPKTNQDTAHMIMKRMIREFEHLTPRDSIKGVIPSISVGFGIKTNISTSIQDVLSEAETNMYKRKMLSKDSVYSNVITSMKTTLYEKSSETEDHANRLYQYCKAVAMHYDITEVQYDELELLCMLHDVGKIAIPDTILNKTEPLTKKDWEQLRTHPEIGYRIANATPHLQKIGVYILHHHEWYDGSGYPSGQEKEQIPLFDRILSVADAYDAMTHDRVYRKAISKEDAILELKRNKGTQFDPKVVDLFIDYITTKELNDSK